MRKKKKLTIAKTTERLKKVGSLKKPKKPVKPKKKKINSRNKGKCGELELASFLKERGIEARRGQQYEGSSDSPDIIAQGCLREVHIEVKRVEAGNLYGWLEQACTDADLCKVPVVAHRKNGKQWVAILDLRDFINIMEKAHAKSEQPK